MKKRITDSLMAVVLVVFALTFAVGFALNFKPLYNFDISLLDIPQQSGLSNELIEENYNRLIKYNSVFNTKPLEFEGLEMSEEGRIHFEDVRAIFVAISITWFVSAAILAVGIIYKKKRKEFEFFKLGSILSVVVPVVLGAMVSVNWQWFFVKFHEIAFSNDYWIFDPIKDPIITILPSEFFMHSAVLLLGVIILFSWIYYSIWHKLCRGKNSIAINNIIKGGNSAVKDKEIIDVLRRSIAIIDPKLVAHGDRVTFLIFETITHSGKLEKYQVEKLCVLSVFHDLGVGKVNEVDEVLESATKDMMKHSIYGYVFLKHLSPLGDFADSILYHHMSHENIKKNNCQFPAYAEIIHLMDRIEIEINNTGAVDFEALRKSTSFNSELVEDFIAANKTKNLVGRCVDGSYVKNMPHIIAAMAYTPNEILEYLKMLVYIIDFISPHTVTHTINTTSISVELAKRLGYTGRDIDVISYGAFLHDIGKIAVTHSILEAPGKLSAEEMEKVRAHITVTDDILKNVVSDEVRFIAARHHEKLNGTGYPQGLTAKDLTEPQRIVAVADIVSALIGARSYKDPFPKEKAIGIISAMCERGELDEKICKEVIAGYDVIVTTAIENQKPVVELYKTIAKDYERMLKEHNLA